ncbi:CsbD family protein [Dapis sp. BLCC M229]|uniref:CsbD family protein n=1 Tax=Dapis sp. BLCC M229 TaxID=3400188 RepID=UPI003CF44952
MGLINKIKAAFKKLQGQSQETLGEITGDNKQKIQGKKKQIEASVQQSVENVKDRVKKMID